MIPRSRRRVLLLIDAPLARARRLWRRSVRVGTRRHEGERRARVLIVAGQIVGLLGVVVGAGVGRSTGSAVGEGRWHGREPRRQRRVLVH
jgi:hypothetical protein